MMTRTMRRGMLGLLIIAALLIPLGIASAKELVGIDISGPGIDGTLHIEDPQGLADLMKGDFFLFGPQLARLDDEARAALGEGFHITTYLMLEGPEPAPFQEMIYYPDPAAGDGYLYLAGPASPQFEGGTQDTWFRLRPDKEALLLDFLARHDITIENGVASVGRAAAVEQAPAHSEAAAPQAESVAPVVEQPAASANDQAAAGGSGDTASAPTPARPAIPVMWTGAAAVLVVALTALGWRLRAARIQVGVTATGAPSGTK